MEGADRKGHTRHLKEGPSGRLSDHWSPKHTLHLGPNRRRKRGIHAGQAARWEISGVGRRRDILETKENIG